MSKALQAQSAERKVGHPSSTALCHEADLRPGWAVGGPAEVDRAEVDRAELDRAEPATRKGPNAGLRRVDWVRIFVDRDRRPMRAEAEGVGHRLPVTLAIPLSFAADLIASGTPYVVCRKERGR